MKHNEPFEDDGRTVADMSGIEHDSICRAAASRAIPPRSSPNRLLTVPGRKTPS